MAHIRLDLCRITDFFQADETLSRPAIIQLRKAAIYSQRNQYLSQLLQSDLQNTDFARTSYGKPYLKKHADFYFNHSHSQAHYVLASSFKIADLGVDIEDLNRAVRFEALAAHAFHADERAHWQATEFDPHYWFKVWTTKEALLKASGLGIRLNLKELNTRVHPLHAGGMCQHAALGSFAYQNFTLPHAMLTVAWAAEASCHGFHFPTIELHQ